MILVLGGILDIEAVKKLNFGPNIDYQYAVPDVVSNVLSTTDLSTIV